MNGSHECKSRACARRKGGSPSPWRMSALVKGAPKFNPANAERMSGGKLRRTHCEQMFSGLARITDIDGVLARSPASVLYHLRLAALHRLNSLEPLKLRVPKIKRLVVTCP